MNIRAYLPLWTKILHRREKIVTESIQSIFDIDFPAYKESGNKLVIFDFDDTLAAFHASLSQQSKKFLAILYDQGWQIALHSNFPPERYTIIADLEKSHNIFASKKGGKPGVIGYQEILHHFSAEPNQVIMIGDRIGTDLLGAYHVGITERILVKPYSTVFGGKKPPFRLRLIRSIERAFFS